MKKVLALVEDKWAAGGPDTSNRPMIKTKFLPNLSFREVEKTSGSPPFRALKTVNFSDRTERQGGQSL